MTGQKNEADVAACLSLATPKTLPQNTRPINL